MLAGKRVLVVDDNTFNREVATDFLASAGIVVETAIDGLDAIEKIEAGDYDAVLMDTHMPRMDGLTAVRELRRNPRWRTLPIVSLTAQARAEDQEASLRAGMSAYLTKPIDEIALFRTLLEVMSNDAQESVKDEPAVEASATGDLRLAEATRRLRGPESTARLLSGFIRDNADAPQRLRDHLASRNLDALASLIHSIKGSASYFSSREFFLAGDEIEHATRGANWNVLERELPSYAERLARLLADTRAGIEALCSSRGVAEATFDPHRILELIESARPLIEHGEFAAVEILERLRAELRGTVHEGLVRSAQAHFDELELDAAASALNRLVESIAASNRGSAYG